MAALSYREEDISTQYADAICSGACPFFSLLFFFASTPRANSASAAVHRNRLPPPPPPPHTESNFFLGTTDHVLITYVRFIVTIAMDRFTPNNHFRHLFPFLDDYFIHSLQQSMDKSKRYSSGDTKKHNPLFFEPKKSIKHETSHDLIDTPHKPF